MIGKTISHYKIVEKLGEGGMGVVYRAEDTTLKRDVALKFLHPEMTRDPEAKARFLQEARAAAALNHPNICTVYEIGESDGQTFIAMALIEGESLKDRIERGPLGLSDAVDLALQVSEGLAAAHKKGIVHRDMKPANVMVTAEDRGKIMDFGLAKSRGQARLTRTGTTTGTIAYMSPEQSRGENVDHRTDIWSFGVMLYEMVTGRRPFAGDYEQAVVYAIANAEPEPVTGLRTGVPMALERIIRKAMAKRVDERYQHADDVIADLKSLKRELDSGTATVSVVAAAPAKRRMGGGAVWRWAAVAAIAVVAAAMVWRATHRNTSQAYLDPEKVVVAVFENRTSDPSLDAIGRMATDAIAGGLTEIGVVEVVPTPILGEAESKDEPASLAAATGAGLVLSGTYYMTGDTLRFRGELFDMHKQRVVAAIPVIPGHRGSPTAAIEDLRQRAMSAVGLYMEPVLALAIGQITNPPMYEAYREYSLGSRLFGADYPAAIERFERAAALDTTFMTPWLDIVWCYCNQSEWPKADSLTQRLAERRERLSPHEERHLDYVRAYIKGNHGEVLRLLRLIRQTAPDDACINYNLGLAALAMNRPGEAAAALSKAPLLRLQDSAHFLAPARPYYHASALHLLGEYEEELRVIRQARDQYPDVLWLNASEARALVTLGRLDEVEALIEESLTATGYRGSAAGVMYAASEALRVHVGREEAVVMAERSAAERRKAVEGKTVADDWAGHYFLAVTLYNAEHWPEAREIFLELAQVEPELADDYDVNAWLGIVAARLGDQDEARATLDDLLRLDDPYVFGGNTYAAACIAALLGERELAVELLRQALSEGFGETEYFHTDMDLEPLHGYPPFEELRRPKG